MTAISHAAVEVGHAQITIDAEVLAPRLGLTVDALKENMAKGLVVSVTETGQDEDAGRTRLTFRYRARVWRVVIDTDGTLFEDPVPVVQNSPAKGMISLFDLAKGVS